MFIFLGHIHFLLCSLNSLMSLFWRTRRQLSYSSVLYVSQCSTFRDLFKYSVQAWIDSDIHRIDGYPVDNYKWDHYCTIHWMVIYLVDSTIQQTTKPWRWDELLLTYIESLNKTLSHGLQDKSATMMVMIDFALSTKFFLSFQCFFFRTNNMLVIGIQSF